MNEAAADQGFWREWVNASERPIAVDLFSGAGGLSYGLEAAGYRVILAVDIDEWALETHAHNFAGQALNLDLGNDQLRAEFIRHLADLDIDLIAGGPPCQPFSRAGRSKIRSLVELGSRAATDTRRELWRAFLDVVEGVRPKTVLMENVPDMALGDDTIVLRHMLDRLELAGYEVDARIVDTWQYGVPQHRQRLIVAGTRVGTFEWPAHAEKVTVQDAIGDLPVLQVEANEPIGEVVLKYDPNQSSDFALRARKQCTGDHSSLVYDHLTRAVRADDLQAFGLMKPGTLYSELPKDLQRYRDDIFDDKYNRLGWNDLSRSITAHIAKDGYWYIHPDQDRTLTVREAARIQTFPDHFRFAGTRSHQFHQIGNAVPPALAEAMGASLLEGSRSEVKSEQQESARRARSRVSLLNWAKDDRQGAPWAYPGDPWTVAVGLLLGAKGESAWPSPSQLLDLAPSFADATPQRLAVISAMASPGRRAAAIRKVIAAAGAVRQGRDGWESTEWLLAAGLGPAARSWYRLLAGESLGLVASSAALRVTARFTGTDVDRQNRNSAGRMEMAKLVGGSENAATLNAAMHRLGSLICTSESPNCHACPLREDCAGRPT